MNDQLTEQEQLQAIKNWWKENGTQVLIAGCLVAVAYFGYNWWTNSKETKLNSVSAVYEQYLDAIGVASSSLVPSDEQVRTVDFHTDQLIEVYGSTHYAFLAVLNTAAFDVRRGEWESALERLDWARSQSKNEADQQLVNYRYALLRGQLGESEVALDLLSDSNEHFASLYAEARGDILQSLGRSSEALSEYQTARAAVSLDDRVRTATLDAKIDSLTSGVLALSTDSE